MTTIFNAVLGDITKLQVDAIVNAANTSLQGGSGVDGAIHRAAGPDLAIYCLRLGGCKPGQAKITPAFKLPCNYVIHTVGPYWRGGNHGESEVLGNCYRTALRLASENAVKTIAFPSISTGIYGYPIAEAAEVALTQVRSFCDRDKSINSITFCCFSPSDLAVYRSLLEDS